MEHSDIRESDGALQNQDPLPAGLTATSRKGALGGAICSARPQSKQAQPQSINSGGYVRLIAALNTLLHIQFKWCHLGLLSHSVSVAQTTISVWIEMPSLFKLTSSAHH